MKKSKFLSLLGTLIVPTLLLGALFTGTKFSLPTIKASADVGEKYIPFNATNFTVNTNPVGFNDANDWVTGRYGTFWTHRYFNALDNFYDGFINEEWTGTVTSRTWTHTGGYLTFTLGGNPLDDEDNVVNRVAVMAGEDEIASIHNDAFQDPSLSLNMIVKVVDIPTQYINHDLHLKIIDGKTNDFGGITFGALKVNQTALEVTRTIKTHQVSLASIDTDTVDTHKNSLAKTVTLSAYSTDPVYEPFLETTLTSVNEDFEVNGMTNWGYDIDYSQISTGNTNKYLGINFGTAVSSDTTFFDEDVPFNKEGTSFYNGWDAAPTETAKYRYLSAPMTVTGSGIMSVKMGGRTSELQILKASDLSLRASFRNPSFVDAGSSKIVSTGSRLATMTRIVVDASAFVNEEVIIALADAELGDGWGVVFFDELVTQYAVAPSFKLDLLSHQGENGVNKDMFLRADGSANDSDIKAAYEFLQEYYFALRTNRPDFTYCSLLDGDPSLINTKLGEYDGLTSGARAIVDGSQDYSYGLVEEGDENLLHKPVDLTDVGSSINYMRANVGTSGSSLRNIPATVKSDSIILVTLIALASITALALYFNVKKTKRD